MFVLDEVSVFSFQFSVCSVQCAAIGGNALSLSHFVRDDATVARWWLWNCPVRKSSAGDPEQPNELELNSIPK